jgi:hypothetical protein
MKEPKKKKPVNYLSNSNMLAELAKCHAQNKLTEEMGAMFKMLVTRYATIPRFSGYSYNDDMRSFALLTLCKVWKQFNAEKYNNPFAYFTQITHHAFHQIGNQERRQRDIRDALLVDQGKNPSFNYAERMSDSYGATDDYGDNDQMETYDKEEKHDYSDVDEIVAEITSLQEKAAENAATESETLPEGEVSEI